MYLPIEGILIFDSRRPRMPTILNSWTAMDQSNARIFLQVILINDEHQQGSEDVQ